MGTLGTLAELLEMYAAIGLALFLTVGMLLATHFRRLRLEIEEYLQLVCYNAAFNFEMSERSNGSSTFILRLKKWRSTYNKLYETVHQFQICFGPILLIWISFFFTSFINNSFFVVDAFVRYRSDGFDQIYWNLIFYFIRNTSNLFIAITVPVIIHQEVSKYIFPIYSQGS